MTEPDCPKHIKDMIDDWRAKFGGPFVRPGETGTLLAILKAIGAELVDSERLEWLMRNISGIELRRLGIITSGGFTREHIDVASQRKADPSPHGEFWRDVAQRQAAVNASVVQPAATNPPFTRMELGRKAAAQIERMADPGLNGDEHHTAEKELNRLLDRLVNDQFNETDPCTVCNALTVSRNLTHYDADDIAAARVRAGIISQKLQGPFDLALTVGDVEAAIAFADTVMDHAGLHAPRERWRDYYATRLRALIRRCSC